MGNWGGWQGIWIVPDQGPCSSIYPHTEGNAWQGRGLDWWEWPTSRSLPSAIRLQSSDGEPGTEVGGGEGGWLHAAWEDGSDPRPGIGTVPTHKFREPGF